MRVEHVAARIRVLAEANIDDLFAYFVRRVANRDEAADLIGETMLVVWRRAKDAPSDELRARMWMFGIARRVLLNHERGRRRRSDLALRIRERITAETPNTYAGEEYEDVRRAVKLLPPKQREVVLLVYGEGFSLLEVSRITATSASTTRSRHAYALAALRQQLAPQTLQSFLPVGLNPES